MEEDTVRRGDAVVTRAQGVPNRSESVNELLHIYMWQNVQNIPFQSSKLHVIIVLRVDLRTQTHAVAGIMQIVVTYNVETF